MKVLIEVKDLMHKFFLGKNELIVINNVKLEVFRGEFISLIGPSGSGKSTLLNLIGGLCRPSQGEIVINAANIKLSIDEGVGASRLFAPYLQGSSIVLESKMADREEIQKTFQVGSSSSAVQGLITCGQTT